MTPPEALTRLPPSIGYAGGDGTSAAGRPLRGALTWACASFMRHGSSINTGIPKPFLAQP